MSWLLTKMDMLFSFIELIKNTATTFDTLVGPYKSLHILVMLDGTSILKQFFLCDLPITFGQYVALQKYTYWWVYSPYVLRKGSLYKVNCNFFNLCFSKNYFANTKEFIEYFVIQNLTQNLNISENQATSNFGNYNTIFYNMLEFQNLFGKVNIKSFYALTCLLHDIDVELGITIDIIKYEFKKFAKFNKLYHWVAYPDFPFSVYNNFYVNILYIKIFSVLNEHSVVFFNIVTTILFFLVFFFLFFKFFIQAVRKIQNTFFLKQKLLKEHDQEVSSFEDIYAFILFFCAFFVTQLNLYNSSLIIKQSLAVSFWLLFVIFLMLVILTPISILASAGSNCLVYIKGAEKYNSIFALIVFDTISMIAFFLRFFLQTIRWCLFLTTYYLLHEFVFEWAYSYFLNVWAPQSSSNATYYWLSNNIVLQILINFLRFAFEFLDTCLILVIQVTAFVAVILWLFNYLFSTSLDDIYENLFEDKLNVKC